MYRRLLTAAPYILAVWLVSAVFMASTRPDTYRSGTAAASVDGKPEGKQSVLAAVDAVSAPRAPHPRRQSLQSALVRAPTTHATWYNASGGVLLRLSTRNAVAIYIVVHVFNRLLVLRQRCCWRR